MLELPEVEVAAERLRLCLTGRRTEQVRVMWLSALQCAPGLTATDVPRLDGARVRAVSRHGRLLSVSFDNELSLVVNFGPAGLLRAGDAAGTILRLLFEGAALSVVEPREPRRVAVGFARRPERLPMVRDLGLDAGGPGLTIDRLRSLLRRRDRPLRHVLTDQRTFAGLGPALVDEALFEARLSPFAASGQLQPDEAIRLLLGIKKALQTALVHYRGLPADLLPDAADRPFLRVHRRKGQQCPQCGAIIAVVRDGHSLANYCPHCQAGDTVLADREPSRPG